MVALAVVFSAIAAYARALVYRYAVGQPTPGIPTELFAGVFRRKGPDPLDLARREVLRRDAQLTTLQDQDDEGQESQQRPPASLVTFAGSSQPSSLSSNDRRIAGSSCRLAEMVFGCAR